MTWRGESCQEGNVRGNFGWSGEEKGIRKSILDLKKDDQEKRKLRQGQRKLRKCMVWGRESWQEGNGRGKNGWSVGR